MDSLIINEVDKLREFIKTSKYGFFLYCQTFKPQVQGMDILVNSNNYFDGIKSNKYYALISFRTYICEIIYNGINLFPGISEYTIECTNNIGVRKLVIKPFGNECYGRLLADYDTDVFELSKSDIYEFYIANRIKTCDYEKINALVAMLWGGFHTYEPSIKTSYVCDISYCKKI